ncbi:MAG TPA: pyridoxamine 5'-phosphate oxidase family protein [Acidimicrobiales bacterium]|nr:pyridoxamine 5'-phosphate oxidase family protein [Acidimicrobiales bacterium]
MYESQSDYEELQQLLDVTYERAGSHLLSIIGPERRLHARALAAELDGYCLLSLATVSSAGQPLVSPVDAIFYRGHFYFSTGEDAVRRRHINRDPRVSGSYVPRAEFAVTVHGVATVVDHHRDDMAQFKDALIATFVPLFGAGFADFVEETPTYYRVDAEKMYCYYRGADD